MDNLGSQMATLSRGVATAARERERLVTELKVQTANMLRAFGRERAATVKALKSGLASDRMHRSADMLAMRHGTSMMCEAFRQEHARMRRSLRQRLVQSRRATVTSVASLRTDVAKERSALSRSHRQMAKELRAGVGNDCRDRAHAVADLMKGFHESRGQMEQELAERLARSKRAMKAQVSGLSWSGHPLLMRASAPARPSASSFPPPVSAAENAPEMADEEMSVEEMTRQKTSLGETVRGIVGKSLKAKKK